MARIAGFIVCLLSAFTFTPAAEQAPLLAQQPALSASQIAFVTAGDIWSVPRAGGEAKRLTVGQGIEAAPSFSPDGKWVAFTGQYDGNTDVFVIPAEGGVPRRLTWHPSADVACAGCRECRVECTHGFDVKSRALDILRLLEVPPEFLG